MRIATGQGGWVGVDNIGLPGPLYVRFRESSDGRLEICEIYIDGGASAIPLSQRDLRELPLTRIESFANSEQSSLSEVIRNYMNNPTSDLSMLASHFQRIHGITEDERVRKRRTWVDLSLIAQLPDEAFAGSSDTRPPLPTRPKRTWSTVSDADSYRMSRVTPPVKLTEEFLRDIARAYTAATSRGERPNIAIQEQTGADISTVRRWVYTARMRGALPRGRQGKVG